MATSPAIDAAEGGSSFKQTGSNDSSLTLLQKGIAPLAAGVEPWDLNAASYSKAESTLTSSTYSVIFSLDGLKMYGVVRNDNLVEQYDLAVAWELSTLSSVVGSFSIASQATNAYDLFLSPDGVKLYVLNNSNVVYQYTLATPGDVSTASYDSVSFSLTSQSSGSRSITFTTDGMRMYYVADTNSSVYQYTLSTPWDLSSLVYDSKFYNFNAEGSDFWGFVFKSDYTQMFGISGDYLYEYDILDPDDISSASYSQKSLYVRNESSDFRGVFFRPDGLRFFLVSNTAPASVHQYDISARLPWNIGAAAYFGNSFSVASEDLTPNGIALSVDGTRMYVIGEGNDRVYQYDLSIAGKISSAVYNSVFYSFSGQQGSPEDIFFKPDGTRMYLVGLSPRQVESYTLSSAWDISTTSPDSLSYDFNPEDTQPRAIALKSDGLRMFMLGDSNNSIFSYTLTIAWDVSSMVYDSISFSVASETTRPESLMVRDNGLRLFVAGNVADEVYQYDMTAEWGLSTAAYNNIFYELAGPNDSPTGLFINADGIQMYSSGDLLNSIYQYTLAILVEEDTETLEGGNTFVQTGADDSSLTLLQKGIAPLASSGFELWDLSAASYSKISASLGSNIYSTIFSPDGLRMYTINRSSRLIEQYDLSAAWDLDTLSAIIGSFDAAQDAFPYDIFISPDGTKLFMGGLSERIYQYTLSVPWIITSATYDSVNFSVSAQDTSFRAMTFNASGTRMYYLGAVNYTVYQYSLTTAWDVATMSYDSKFFALTEETSFWGVGFKDDGTRVFAMGRFFVHEYQISDPTDISTASYSQKSLDVKNESSNFRGIYVKPDGSSFFLTYNNPPASSLHQYDISARVPWSVDAAAYLSTFFSVASEDLIPNGVSLSADGSRMYVIGEGNDRVYQYDLSIAGKVSSAVYNSVSYSFSGQQTIPQDIVFKPDGTRMYLVGTGPRQVESYTLTTAWDIGTASPDSLSYDLGPEDTEPTAIAFKADGLKMFMLGDSNNSVFSYTLTSAWDVTSASYDSVSFSVAAETTRPEGLVVSDNGLRIFVAGNTNIEVYQYDMTADWDLSTAAYNSISYKLTDDNGDPTGLFINAEGTQLYSSGDLLNGIYQYTLAIATVEDTETLEGGNTFIQTGADDGSTTLLEKITGFP